MTKRQTSTATLIRPARSRTKRVGRGIGSGLGKTAGRGMNGQRARSGGGVRIGFEGGQMPLYRRLPRRGFSNSLFKTQYRAIPLAAIVELFNEQEHISYDALQKKGVVRNNRLVKIVSGGKKIDKKLTLDLERLPATKTVIAAIEKGGGTIIYPGAVQGAGNSKRTNKAQTAGNNTRSKQTAGSNTRSKQTASNSTRLKTEDKS